MSGKSKTLSIEELNKELKDFLYIITHDLKNPVRGIKQSADWLLADYQSRLDDQGVKLLEMLQNKSSLLSEMIDSLNSYSKISFKESIITEFSFDVILDSITAKISRSMTKERQKKKLKLTKEYDKSLIITSDEVKFGQILHDVALTGLGVCSNEQQEISCTIACIVEKEKNHQLFKISFTDCLVDQARLRNFFDPFQELQVGSEKFNTMMHLVSAKKLVELFKGEITANIDSTKKLEFSITYPMSVE